MLMGMERITRSIQPPQISLDNMGIFWEVAEVLAAWSN